MKRLLLFALASSVLMSTGCGQRSMNMATAPTSFGLPARTIAPVAEANPAVVEAPKPTAPAPAVTSTPLQRLEADLKQVAAYGPLIQNLDTLGAGLDNESAYGVMATPESTQAKAVATARAWASDAEQLYLGWGFKWLTFIGHSRHVFWSNSKKKLLTLDYGFWGNLSDQVETDNLAMRYGSSIIRQLLREPSDRHEFNGKEAFQRAKKAGLQAPTQGAIKAILLDIYFLGPVWIFFDYRNEPAMLVDGNDGRVISDSYVLDILKYLL